MHTYSTECQTSPFNLMVFCAVCCICFGKTKTGQDPACGSQVQLGCKHTSAHFQVRWSLLHTISKPWSLLLIKSSFQQRSCFVQRGWSSFGHGNWGARELHHDLEMVHWQGPGGRCIQLSGPPHQLQSLGWHPAGVCWRDRAESCGLRGGRVEAQS